MGPDPSHLVPPGPTAQSATLNHFIGGTQKKEFILNQIDNGLYVREQPKSRLF
jgi:hypothetical protein